MEIKKTKEQIPYIKAIKYLEKRVNEIKTGKGKELLWILEHPRTFTAGISANKNEILDKKITVLKTNRGGKITLHNPGQKIIYFVLNLNNRKKDIRNLINLIEKSIIQFLELYGIKSKSDRKKIGIWVQDKKIAAIGVRVTKWIAYHGCSININNNLDEYKKILPCGLDNKNITSIENEGIKSIKNIDKNLIDIFHKNLKMFS